MAVVWGRRDYPFRVVAQAGGDWLAVLERDVYEALAAHCPPDPPESL